MSHAPTVALLAGSGAADGIHEVPDPMRSIETPSGSGAIAIAVTGVDSVSLRTVV
jgi:hypothetical protein